jgi:mercuric ion transport protein
MPNRSQLRGALAAVAAVFAALILVQVFLAGLGVFDDPRSFVTHRNFGYLIGWFTLVLVVLAVAGRAGRRLIGLSVLALAQMALQSVFVLVRDDLPAVAALHPVNGVLLLLVVLLLARGAWQSRGATTQAHPATAREGAVV